MEVCMINLYIHSAILCYVMLDSYVNKCKKKRPTIIVHFQC